VSFSVALQRARSAKKWSQQELANALNQPLTVIKQYESGKAKPNGMLIHKMNTVLGVKLPSQKKK
jgi:putative transcription factor